MIAKAKAIVRYIPISKMLKCEKKCIVDSMKYILLFSLLCPPTPCILWDLDLAISGQTWSLQGVIVCILHFTWGAKGLGVRKNNYGCELKECFVNSNIFQAPPAVSVTEGAALFVGPWNCWVSGGGGGWGRVLLILVEFGAVKKA